MATPTPAALLLGLLALAAGAMLVLQLFGAPSPELWSIWAGSCALMAAARFPEIGRAVSREPTWFEDIERPLPDEDAEERGRRLRMLRSYDRMVALSASLMVGAIVEWALYHYDARLPLIERISFVGGLISFLNASHASAAGAALWLLEIARDRAARARRRSSIELRVVMAGLDSAPGSSSAQHPSTDSSVGGTDPD